MRGDLGVVRGDDQRHLFFGAKILEQLNDFAAGVGIEVAGGLIGQQQFRLVDEGAGDGDALLFAAGKLVGLVFHRGL